MKRQYIRFVGMIMLVMPMLVSAQVRHHVSQNLSKSSPFKQYNTWIAQAKAIPHYRRLLHAVVLGTLTQHHKVALRYIELYPKPNGFIFFTKTNGGIARDIQHDPHVSIVQLIYNEKTTESKQIQIMGKVDKIVPVSRLHIRQYQGLPLTKAWSEYRIKPSHFQFTYWKLSHNRTRFIRKTNYDWVYGHWNQHEEGQ